MSWSQKRVLSRPGDDLIKVHRVPELLVGTDYGTEQSWRREMGWEGAGVGGDRGQHRGFCGMRIGERVWLYFEGRADWIF